MRSNNCTVLINCSACVLGGSVQVAAGFLRHLISVEFIPFKPVVALSLAVDAECGREVASRFPVILTTGRPGAPLAGLATRRSLRAFANSQSASAVFTILGPSYVSFSQPELMGFADGFLLAENVECYKRHPWTEMIRARLLNLIKLNFLRGSRSYWVEASSAKDGLVRKLGVNPSAITVIPNALNPVIRDRATGTPPSSTPTFLLLAAGYWHKNHILAPDFAKALAAILPGREFKVSMTLPPGAIWDHVRARAARLGVADRIANLGPLSLDGCARAIEAATAVLHPSLLETFSATYLEAMGLSRPLLASDRRFARDICGDAALYFDPLDPVSAAHQAARLLLEPGLAADLVERGRRRLASFPSPEEKNARLVDLITTFVQQHEYPPSSSPHRRH